MKTSGRSRAPILLGIMVLVAALAVVLAPGGAASAPSAAVMTTLSDTVPTDADALFGYLQEGKYKGFAHEAEKHTSMGPHPDPQSRESHTVIAFFNSGLDASLKAGNEAHPEGSAAVKEFYGADGELSGWAVSVKTQAESATGQGWFWYEVISVTDGSAPVAAGNGVALCWGCHSSGNDFVLSQYPAED
jgi:hypothetical protein